MSILTKLVSKVPFVGRSASNKPKLEAHLKSPRPERDWLVILITFACAVVFIGVANVFLYQKVVRGEFLRGAESVSGDVDRVDREELEAVLSQMKQQEERFRSLGGVLPADVDVTPAATSTATTTPSATSTVDEIDPELVS